MEFNGTQKIKIEGPLAFATKATRQKWEYKLQAFPPNPTDENMRLLNIDGDDGWEAVAIDTNERNVLLKRPKLDMELSK